MDYDDVIDVHPDAVVVTDSTGTVVAANRACERILGIRPDSAVGRPLPDVLPLVDDAGRDWWQCTDPWRSPRSRVRQPERELTLATPEGDVRILVTAALVRAADGSLDRLVVACRDTHARRRLERSGAELVSTVAHELRSPLTSVKGFTATLLQRWERFTDEQRLHMLATINSDADRVTRLISELLDVSRIEAGRLELRKTVVDLEAILRRDVEARIAAGDAADQYVLDLDPSGLPETWADPDKLAQVVGNVVENARRHGRGRVTLTLRRDAEPLAGEEDPGALITVMDEGSGIPANLRGRVFGKFWRASKERGTGLGLYIAKGIVDAHGGTIEIGAAPGGGALVVVRLPAGTPDFAR